jgi:Zinc carboxypeptidase
MKRLIPAATAVRHLLVGLMLLTIAVAGRETSARQSLPQTPEQFFGFRMGTDGELARYPRILEYLQHLAKTTSRIKYQELGKTTMGNPYVLATVSSPENLARLDKLVAINRRLADPRGLSEADAKRLALEGRAFYFIYATIHSTEVGNTQALNEIVHRLATDNSPDVRQILDNVVVLVVPSQNPDGQVLVIDHWYKTKGTPFARVYPDLYHKYTGHDDNRDWFMFTQTETRLAVEKVHSVFKPVITHDMHQQGAGGSRIFVPPYDDPYDPNIHPILAHGMTSVGQAMASALVAEGKTGVEQNARYDLWAPARQYMVYHGQSRILTEIASVNLADPYVNPAGKDVPLGPQEARWNFLPYGRGEWRLRQIVEYGVTAAFAGMSHVAKSRTSWLENFYKVHADWVNRKAAPYAFVIPAGQRDPYETYELLDILRIGDVELHQAKAAFTANGRQYSAGSWVIKLAQPYGAFAKTMLERQRYPDLRLFPGGPPKPPYDVAGHTLGLLMGVEVEQIEQPFEAVLEPVKMLRPPVTPMTGVPQWAYLVGPESNAAFIAVARLQAAGITTYRSSREFASSGRTFAAGTWIVPPSPEARRILADVAISAGLAVAGADKPLQVDAFRLKPGGTRIGLWRGANNMPGGWMKWLFEQYGFNHRTIASTDFAAGLESQYDAIVLPSGTSREMIVRGLDPKRNDKEWTWAYGVGEEGWKKLAAWVHAGGTLVAIGSAVETARELLDLPIEQALPEASRGRRGGGEAAARDSGDANRILREAFSSPARLDAALRERVIDPASLFYCPGSLLQNEFNTAHPVAFGMPSAWPVFFESDQAYRLKPGFAIQTEVVSRYPADGPILQSGWLLGESYLRGQANVLAFRVGNGYVVTMGSQVDFRTQPRATFKLLFNALFHGPSTRVPAAQIVRLTNP